MMKTCEVCPYIFVSQWWIQMCKSWALCAPTLVCPLQLPMDPVFVQLSSQHLFDWSFGGLLWTNANFPISFLRCGAWNDEGKLCFVAVTWFFLLNNFLPKLTKIIRPAYIIAAFSNLNKMVGKRSRADLRWKTNSCCTTRGLLTGMMLAQLVILLKQNNTALYCINSAFWLKPSLGLIISLRYVFMY